jgi:dihydroneopterin aldolase
MKINISNLTFKAIIGILDFERQKAQRVIVDCSFKYEFDKSLDDSNNKNFIDYSLVAKDIKKTIKKKKFLLIEDAIINLEKKLIQKYGMKNLNIKITKPDILDDCIVSVQNSN